MKAAIFHLTLILMAIINAASAAVYLPDELTSLKFANSSSSQLVKAKIVNGSLMPVVDLPVVEITGEEINRYYVPGKIEDGSPLAVVDLPQVEIFASETETESVMEPVAEFMLPVVEIVATPLKTDMVRADIEDDSSLRLYADLPEVEIVSEKLMKIQVASLPEYKAYLIKTMDNDNVSILFASKFSELMAFAKSEDACEKENNVYQSVFTIRYNDSAVLVKVKGAMVIPSNREM